MPDDDRAQRLARLRGGEVELTEDEQKRLQAVQELQQARRKVTNHAVYGKVGSNYGQVAASMKKFRQLGLLVQEQNDDGDGEA